MGGREVREPSSPCTMRLQGFGQPVYEVKGAAFLWLASPWLKKGVRRQTGERKRAQDGGIRACPPKRTLMLDREVIAYCQEGACEAGSVLLGASPG